MSKCRVYYINEKSFRNADGEEELNRRTILIQQEDTENYYKVFIYTRTEGGIKFTSSYMAPVEGKSEPYIDNDDFGFPDVKYNTRSYDDDDKEGVIEMDLLAIDMNRYPYKDNTMELDKEKGVSLERYRELLGERFCEREL